jgi:acyl carrier protein
MSIDQIREIVQKHARLSVSAAELEQTSDLYAAGLTSLTTVHLMLALEDHFEVEFPDRMLSRKTFESLQSISEAVEELLA